MKTTRNLGIAIAAGAAICVITALVLLSVFAWLIANAYISEDVSSFVCTGVLIVSTIAGTLTATMKSKEKALWISLITALNFGIILLSCNAIFFDGIYDGVFVTLVCIVGSAICTVLLNTQKSRKRKQHVKRGKW